MIIDYVTIDFIHSSKKFSPSSHDLAIQINNLESFILL